MEAAGGSERKRPRERQRPPRRSISPAGADEIESGKVRELLAWLSENDGGHLTAAQMGQYVLLQAVTLNGPFGRLLEN